MFCVWQEKAPLNQTGTGTLAFADKADCRAGKCERALRNRQCYVMGSENE